MLIAPTAFARRMASRSFGLLLRNVIDKRPPDKTIGGDSTGVYLCRWYLIPRNTLFNAYLHGFQRSDEDRALHDHPWWSVSFAVHGSMIEVWAPVARGGYLGPEQRRMVEPGTIVFRSAKHSHRMEMIDGGHAWTVFITGPRIRSWGFWCSQSSPAGGWRHWREFTAETPGSSKLGRGCE